MAQPPANRQSALAATVGDNYGKAGWISPGVAADLRRGERPGPFICTRSMACLPSTQTASPSPALNGRIENNRLNVDGRLKGYDADAPLDWRFPVQRRRTWRFRPGPALSWLPCPNRCDVCDQFKPRGSCGPRLAAGSATPGGPIGVDGRMDILDGGFTFEDFAYPLRHATGAITVNKAPTARITSTF